MFFGNMQSYYRRNSIHNQSSSHGSQSKASKEQVKRVKHLKKNEDGDNEENFSITPVRRKSFSISRNPESEEPEKDFKSMNIPVIKVGSYEAECTEKSINLLIEKEKVPCRKSCQNPDDNSERLGPNKNNIIEETLRLERRKSSEWKQQLYD